MTATAVHEPPKNALPGSLIQLDGAVQIPLEMVYPSPTNRRTVRNTEKDAELCCVHEVVPGIGDLGEKKYMAGFDKRHKIGLDKVRDQVTREMKAKFAEIDKRRAEKETKAKPKLQTSAKAKAKAKAAKA